MDVVGDEHSAWRSAPPILAASALPCGWKPGQVFFRQQRVGIAGSTFTVLKLRTMVVGAEGKGAGYAVDRGDSRITRVGRLLRGASIDELPQLWNVLIGDMSLVGPRPTLAYQVERYDERQRRRLDVRPGLTGWAQVNGRAALLWPERIELDVWYVDIARSRSTCASCCAPPPCSARPGVVYRSDTGGWREPSAMSAPI